MAKVIREKRYYISLRPATRQKYEKIARRHRWSLTETADALADRWLLMTGEGQQDEKEPSAALAMAASP